MGTTKMFKQFDYEVLAFGAHHDDVEAGCGGFLAKVAKSKKKVAIVALSRAELATNGTPEIIWKEALEAAKILGVKSRETLDIPNNFFEPTKENQIKIINVIRKYKPRIVLLPYYVDRHPDHQDCYKLIWPALFTSGLIKFKTEYPPHRPHYVFFYRLWYDFKPTFIVDISEEFTVKMKALAAYKSQFQRTKGSRLTPDNDETFWKYWEARHRNYGYEINTLYGEPYLSLTPIGIKDLNSILPNYF
jgi:bacillithiol biosynthesis deacetylase BshB1